MNLFSRNISDTEHLYGSLQAQFSSFAINMVVEGTGQIDPESLKTAVEKASQASPGSRLIQQGKMWVDSQKTPPVYVLEEGEIPFLEEKMDPVKGPTSEVLLQLNPMKLIFRIYHGTMDGKGVLLWINQVFRALRGEMLLSIDGKDTDLTYMKRQNTYSKRNKFKFDIQAVESFSIKNKKVWNERLTIEGRPACLVAKIAKAMTACAVSQHNRFLIPVDMRRHQKEHLSNANLTQPIFLETTKEESWVDIHTKLLNCLQNNKEMNLNNADLGFLTKLPQFLFNWGVHAFNAYQNISQKHVFGGVISDLGTVDLAELSTDVFQAKTFYSIPVQQPFCPFTVTVVSNKMTTEIVLSCYQDSQLIHHARQILRSLESKSFNDTKRAYPSNKTVIDLIEERIKQKPDAIAIRCEKNDITYSVMANQINLIAKYLSRLGVGSGKIVGVYMGRNALLMPTILAIMKTGASYTPLDIESSNYHLNNILESSNLFACITDQLDIAVQGVLININDINLSQAGSFNSNAKSYDEAYQIYTSGSTGFPKGVQIEHRSLVNYLIWAKETYHVDAESVFPLFASIAFDSTITSMFLPLIAGGSIMVFEEKCTHITLKKIVESPNLTHIKISPAHLQLATKVKAKPGCPKIMIVGGEQLSLKLAKNVHDCLGQDWKIINEYGPTEATVGCITYLYNPLHNLTGHAVPIGRPIMNTKILLLDEGRHPVQNGAIGEIYIVGNCLARGYANDKSLTDDKFIIVDNERAYKTGDLAQMNEFGDLVYVGRLDDQVSINGYRIELGEIENAVIELEGVHEAAIVVKQNKLNKNILIAFYTAERQVSEQSVRTHLQNYLPHVQVHFFVRLDLMPMTTNHKIDKKSLPIPDLDKNLLSKQNTTEYLNQQEMALISIWREVLKISDDCRVNVNDNFYDLGGDSLAMLTVLNELTVRMLGERYENLVMSKMGEFIKSPTIKSFSRIISHIKSDADRCK